MEPSSHFAQGLSPRRIVGFACNQGFVFFLFYTGLNRSLEIGPLTFERVDLIGTLLFMVLTFLLLKNMSERGKKLLTARPALLLYALMLLLGSLIPYFIDPFSLTWLLVESTLIGIPCALFLTAWGAIFGGVSTKVSVPEVFLASLCGALFGLVVYLVPISRADLAFRILPFVSAFILMTNTQAGLGLKHPLVMDDSSRAAALLSVKIIAGTVLFGMAAGLMETFNTDPGMPAMPTYAVAFLLFIAFALGTLSILLSDGFGKGAALNKAYRLAVFIMLMGFVLVPSPFFADSAVSGEAIVLAGYLGLSAVLISLFLVLAEITGTSTSSSFARGFAALFGGELLGVALANALTSTQSDLTTPYFVVVLAAALVLFSYIFLFTERDFDSLSEMVIETDSFEERCKALAEAYAFSNRESEILPFVLKGRTSERISQELFISKSTVDTHLKRIYAKAEVHNRQELIDLSEHHAKFSRH